jgi:uncharacterized protein (DUF885 family)
MDAELASLAAEYWHAVLTRSPTSATLIGDHRFDDRIDDWSVEGEQVHADAMRRLRARAEAVDPATLSEAEVVTRGLLLAETENTLAVIDAGLAELQSDQMTGPHADLFTGAPQVAVPEPAHAAAILERFRSMPRMLDQAAARFRSGTDRGWTPARICVERSLNQLDGYLGANADDDVFLSIVGPQGWDGEEGWRAQLATILAERVRPAFARYRAALADDVLPSARPDDRPGLTHLDGGDDAYQVLIRVHTSLDLPAEEIHRIGRQEIEERLPEEYRRIGERVFGTSDLQEIFERMRSDTSYRFRDADHIVATAQATLDRAKAAIPEWFGRLPEADCLIELVPEFLQADAPPAYYYPPTDDGTRPGTYFVNVRDATGQSVFEAESVGFHEAIPGHHLQLAIANELDDVPDFQRLSVAHTAYVEGWALYAERLAEEMGLYTGDVDRLGMLAADSWRAGRLVVDTGMHALGWSRQQAIDYLYTNAPLSLGEITPEIDRYIGMPGQALASKIGQREVFRLREHAKELLGPAFDIRGFHDVVLGSGAVTLPILADLVDRWIARTAA